MDRFFFFINKNQNLERGQTFGSVLTPLEKGFLQKKNKKKGFHSC